MNEIIKEIDGDAGFYDKLIINKKEIQILKKIINEKYSEVISKQEKKEEKIEEYIKLIKKEKISDNKLWTKKNRMLKIESVKIIKELNFYKELEKNFKEIKITNEENIEEEEMYWRIVRPENMGGDSDVGPAHADSWFWNEKNNIIGKRRIKIWISIIGDKENSGFKYIFGSHKKKWNYQTEIVEGKIKPKKDKNLEKEKFEILKIKRGGTIIFNDNLIHGGYALKNTIRVSLEWTMLINEE